MTKKKTKRAKKSKVKVNTDEPFNCGGKDTTYTNLMKRVKELKEHGQKQNN